MSARKPRSRRRALARPSLEFGVASPELPLGAPSPLDLLAPLCNRHARTPFPPGCTSPNGYDRSGQAGHGTSVPGCASRSSGLRIQSPELPPDGTRLAILKVLPGEGTKAAALSDAAGVNPQMAGHHLGILRMAGLVEETPAGQSVGYRTTKAYI